MLRYIRWFKDLTIADIPSVGGKNASLGEMYGKLTSKGLPVPNGFALTAGAYWAFIKGNKLDKKIKATVKDLNVKNIKLLSKAGSKVRGLILNATFPKDVEVEVKQAYRQLSKDCGQANVDVAVRSSATAEDLPDASFAGQQESYLNVRGERELLLSVKKCIASLFTDRAISYREAKGFDHMAVALSVGVQQMVRSDMASSGVMFTLDTESGFKGVVLINGAYGLGEYVVKGRVTPDQFFVHKEGVSKGFKSIISHRLGSKEVKLVYGPGGGTKQEKVLLADQRKYCLTDDEVVQLAQWGRLIEEHYGHPMDIEWAKDGVSRKLFIVQARSETVKSRAPVNVMETYRLKKRGPVILEGTSVGQKIGQGRARIINNPSQMKEFKAGEVLVTRITDPDWEPVMRIAGAIVTEQGGKTSHAAIVSRELGIPCLVGAKKARQLVKPGAEVTVSCAEGEVGYLYRGHLPFEVEKIELKKLEPTKTKIMMNVGNPDRAFNLSFIPNDGIGLAREEFIFTNFIKVHPLACVHYRDIKDKKVKKQIDELTPGYFAQGGKGRPDKSQFVVDKLAEGIAFIAAAFQGKDVIVRLSDFKTNEYATLIGGADYEPKEENPMLGWRGASRYYDEKFKPAFKLECAAIKKVREEWGLKNVIVMIPFCRTVEEGKKVLATMKEFGLERGQNGLEVYVMCEIPANVILAKEFSEIFDGFSIGSNDLTQLTLGVDRDSALVSHVYDENNLAVKKLIRDVIQTAHRYKRKVGICGQAPSDYPEFAEFLVQEGIDSISLNPDTILKTRVRIAAMEKKVGVRVAAKPLPALAKTASFIGLLFFSLVLAGFSCQAISDREVQDQIKQQVQEQSILAKYQIRQELQAKMEADRKKERSTYTESAFAKFSLNYPSSWQVNSLANGVKLSDADQEFFQVSFKTGSVAPATFNVTTTLRWGFPSKEFLTARDGQDIQVIEIYPTGFKKKNPEFVLSGSKTYFNEILGSIKEFTGK
ncbi:MAG: phosphoenolpyruvate synthase [Candidatus Magasanikbacteria bacterium]|nr:phosphoenolpyruvate synthase [Candidatus Magasanikbacteria bacterium]